MPLFFFISGCVFGYQEIMNGQKLITSNWVLKKTKRLIIPYLFFGLIYVAPFLVFFGYRKGLFPYIYNGILLCYDNRHLWFIISLFTIFLVVFFINKALQGLRYRKETIWVISLIIYIMRDYFPDIFNLRLSANFLLWFIMGYLFIDKTKLYSFILTIISPLCCLFLLEALLQNRNWIFPGLSLLVALMVINSLYIFSSNSKRLYNCRAIKFLSYNCYAIYLFHPILIYFFFHFTKTFAISPLVLSCCAFMFSLLGSIVFIKMIRRWDLKIIIGE